MNLFRPGNSAGIAQSGVVVTTWFVSSASQRGAPAAGRFRAPASERPNEIRYGPSQPVDPGHHWRGFLVRYLGRLSASNARMSSPRVHDALITLMWLAFGVLALTVVAYS